MTLDDRELEQLLRSTAEEDPSPEVDFGTLLELKAGRLEGAAADQARKALLADPELAQAVFDVDRLDALEQAAATVTADRQEAAWERLMAAGLSSSELVEPTRQRETAAQTPASGVSLASRAEQAPRPVAYRRLVARYPLASMAASMLLASALTLWVLQTRSPGISGNLEFESLSLSAEAGPTRSQGVQSSTLVLSRRHTAAILELNPPPRLELSFDLPSSAEVVLFQGESGSEPIATRLQEEGGYLLWIPVNELITGPLRIELRNPTGHRVFAEYSLDVRFDETP